MVDSNNLLDGSWFDNVHVEPVKDLPRASWLLPVHKAFLLLPYNIFLPSSSYEFLPGSSST